MHTAIGDRSSPANRRRWLYLLLSVTTAALIFTGMLFLLMSQSVTATTTDAFIVRPHPQGMGPKAPIPPPAGYPKLALSAKTVTPTLAATGGVTLYYSIEMRNTGATTATNTTLVDVIPAGTTYTGDAWVSNGQTPDFDGTALSWTGAVGFDTTVVVTFSVRVAPGFAGVISNSAVISNPFIARPVTVSAETVVTDEPILAIEKSSSPVKPGANKPLNYQLLVTNWGQPAANLPITVTDLVPADVTLRDFDPYGFTSAVSAVVTWTRHITLALGQTTAFTFSVDVGSVPSGTVITNEQYAVASPFSVASGDVYTVTIVDPIFLLAKHVWPDPPGSNRHMTYTLTLLNVGSLATDIVVTDRVPAGVSYVSGGAYASGVVSWSLPSLDTRASARFTYTVYVSDVMNVPLANSQYGVCSAEGVCAPGAVITSVVQGPLFKASAIVDPIAHKPGGGTGTEVTPTLLLRNVGAGNALEAQATLYFQRLSVSLNDLVVEPTSGTLSDGADCGEKCNSYVWIGDLYSGETVTFTTSEGQSTIGGAEGTHYAATVVVTDVLGDVTTDPISATAFGTVTHFAFVQPLKVAPPAIGAGQLLTYIIKAYNRGLTTALPPVLTDSVPMSTTFVRASDGGKLLTISDTTLVSWTLPLLSPGEGVARSFTVRVNDDLISGTKIVNREYAVFGYGNVVTGAVTGGPPVTTTVKELGLIDSYKVVTPRLALPGPDNVLTYVVHLVNSGPLSLTGVTAYDLLPWAAGTYRRDAVASASKLVSDIISFDWQGDVGPFSEVVVTASVLIDRDFEGAVTNTVVISHPDLLTPVVRNAVAYITAKPVLFIEKRASPDPVRRGARLTYNLHVTNLGQQATALVISDTLPANVQYVPDSATAGGRMVADAVLWNWPAIEPGEKIAVSFQVTVEQGQQVVNANYGVRSAEGVAAVGVPVITRVKGTMVYLPLLLRNSP